jgi:hypothetical protein
MNVIFILLCGLFGASSYDEMNCEFFFRLFYNVF